MKLWDSTGTPTSPYEADETKPRKSKSHFAFNPDKPFENQAVSAKILPLWDGCDNNYDLSGNYLSALNLPAVGGTSATSFGLSLLGSAGASPALTALGLPSNPLEVVTNGSTRPVSIDTNMTISGNLSVSGTNSAAYFAGDMSRGSNYNCANLTGTEPVSVINPIVSTNHTFFVLPPDGFILNYVGGTHGLVTVGLLAGEEPYYGWICPSNSNASIMKSIPLPNDYWMGKTNYVTSWKIRTTVPGSYSLNIGLFWTFTNDVLSSYSQPSEIFTASSGTNTIMISATNQIMTLPSNLAGISSLVVNLYTGNQVQPGDFSVVSGQVTAQ